MATPSMPARRTVASFLIFLVGLLAVLLPASPASAHAALVRTTPAANTVVPTPPQDIMLTFSEPVSVVPSKIRVTGPDAIRADRGEPVVRGNTLYLPLRTDLPRGTFLVNYRVISADSHPVAGGFTFSIGEPSAAPTEAAEETTDPLVRTLIPVVKYIGYLGLVLIVGPALVLVALWPQRLSRRGPARLVWIGLGLTAFATIAEVLLQAPYTTGGSLAGITADSLREVLGSPFGTAHTVRLGVLAAAAFLLRPLLSGRGGTADRALLAILAVVGIATWPLSGHPAASPVPAVTVVSDAAHLASMAVWLGGLVMLVGFLLRLAEDRELAAILPIWSRWAMLAVAVLVLAGTLQALVEVATPAALVTTTYGWLVIAKIGLLGVVLGVAALSRRLVRDRTAEERPGRLRRLIVAELAVTAVVLGVAAALVQTTPARTAAATAQQTVGPFATTVTSPLYSLRLEIDPAQRGNNSIHLFAFGPDGQPVRVVEWKGTAGLASAGIEPIQIPLLRIVDNHSIGEITLPVAGAWEFRFTLRLSEIDQATVSATVPIR